VISHLSLLRFTLLVHLSYTLCGLVTCGGMVILVMINWLVNYESLINKKKS